MTDGTLTDLAAAVRAPGSPVEIVTAYLARIERLDACLRAFITLDAEGALAAVRALEADAAAGRWRGGCTACRSASRTSEVAAAAATALTVLEQRGVRVSPAPRSEDGGRLQQPIVRAECAAVHARVLRERPHERQPVVRSRAEAGFAEADVLVTPTIAEPAPGYKTAKAGSVADVIARMSAFTRFTRVFNTVGLAAPSLPCGFTAAGAAAGAADRGTAVR